MKSGYIIAVSCLLLLAGCSSSDSGSQGNVFKQQTQAIDKAKQAEQQMLQRAQEQKKAIDSIDQ